MPDRPPSVGVMLPYDNAPVPFARLAEDAGFDVLATGEHVLFRRSILNGFVTLSAAAAVTDRIRLMSALTLVPLYPAALAAKLVSSLDSLSGGRLDLGLGVGGEVPEEFAACGVDITRRGRLTDAAIVELRRYFDPDRTVPPGAPDMLPRPVQRAGPPIWVGGRSEAALRRAVRHADGWLPYLMTPDQIRTRRARLGELGAGPLGIRAVVFVGVGSNRRAAEDEAASFVGTLYDLDPDRMRRFVVAGDEPAVADQLAEFIEAGADSILVNLCSGGAEADRMAVRIGESVAPVLRQLSTKEIS